MVKDVDSDAIRIDHETLEAFVRRVLTNGGVDSDPAETVANALVTANLRGIDSHGVARLDAYMRNFTSGGFNPSPDVTTERVKDAVVLVDGDDGPGQYAGMKAMTEAIEVAAEAGVGFASVQNSNHFGTAAYFTQRAAEHDCIGLSMTNVGPDVIPFGGTSPHLGTNPIAFSVPTKRDFPITLDMATSVVAMGKIDHVAAETGEEIPEEWAVDESGQPTTDPHEVHALRPVGGPKGYGLAVIVDVLCGLLSGMGSSPTIGALYGEYDEPMELGHFIGAIDVSAFRDTDAFKEDTEALIRGLKSVEPQEGVDEVLLPGEIEAETRRERECDGIPIIGGVADDLRKLASKYDVELPNAFEPET